MGGFQYMALEWYDEVRASVAETIVQARAKGNLHNVGWNRTVAAHLELRHGRLDAAESAAAEAIPLREILSEAKIDIATAALAGVQAWRGQADACTKNARRATASARAAGDREVEGFARQALALLALGEGKPNDAVMELEPLARLWTKSTVRHPAIVRVRPRSRGGLRPHGSDDQGARPARPLHPGRRGLGKRVDARRMRALRRAPRSGRRLRPPVRGGARPLRGLAVCPRARENATRLRRAPPARAPTCDARIQLQAAHEAFTAAGATLWQERAATELRAAGVHVSSGSRPRIDLTPQELHIATLVAEGKSNKEIAAAMYLSPKTIEYHLANTYRKLDIHSRAELARIIARDGPVGAEPDLSAQ